MGPPYRKVCHDNSGRLISTIALIALPSHRDGETISSLG